MGLLGSVFTFLSGEIAAIAASATSKHECAAQDDHGVPNHPLTAQNVALRRADAALAAENLALKHQLSVYRRKRPRPALGALDRAFWAALSRLWCDWRSALILVKPETVVRWHRMGFKLFWRIKSAQPRRGRPTIEKEVRELIRKMSTENVTWGAPRIRAELKLLGHDAAERTVAKYMVRGEKPPSQTWRTFLNRPSASRTRPRRQGVLGKIPMRSGWSGRFSATVSTI